jgi:hypothetical protein
VIENSGIEQRIVMDREIIERLTEAIKIHAPHLADKLQPALDLANRQLESLCPAVMGMSRTGLNARRTQMHC